MEKQPKLTSEQIELWQTTVNQLAATQASRMSMLPIDQLPLGDPLRRYAEARRGLRAAGFPGEPYVEPRVPTLPIRARMQPY